MTLFSSLKIVRLRQQHRHELQSMINNMCDTDNETRSTDLLERLQTQDATIVQLQVTRAMDSMLFSTVESRSIDIE
jgi:CRISPR/Cas system endoribonuclease Cas6 (RAMP superfamily)